MEQEKKQIGPIGIFDSGYGGLSVFKEIKKKLPQYDYIYLGDNARIPYGTRSFETVYEFTKQCVFKLFDLGCNLVILACNTASAKALRSIQQNDLPPGKKVLGVIRPTTEIVKQFTKTNNVGILATTGTVKSESYKIEINKFYPEIEVFQHDCPFWVPLVENNEIETDGAKYFVEKDIHQLLKQSSDIDTIVLACTHYPLLLPVIKQFVPDHINIISQGPLVANSLKRYLDVHHDMELKSSKNGTMQFYTTDDPLDFESKAEIFFGQKINAKHIKVT
ncbi:MULTISPECIES: glutamate racemase [Sphingobacterium]|jgi:glutamate racemase|uniref:glutamate racemase n=1 Tax=Sphingobacterium TaxID=28453 RepID=UPI00097E969D|nr:MULTISPECIES: glutamate racemase [Sphingobacterium]SJN48710.1 Glutamate racemase [Sphingobacterium faecium PCAi_F2.5]HCU43699.1 glutamate racemase [Sphingobacterium sp.]UPZ36592.1 glutamate racemase [Sphingobacterium sp. PCS056]UXD68109.1 glutamate racemase [Sphingobacterium faecium]WGQ15820.1 glutamate racemase [Sphingobacterium faecium]